MSTNNSKQEESKLNTIPETTTEPKQSVKPVTNTDNDAPLTEQQQAIMNLFRNALNPNGENPQIDEYLTSTFSYVQNVFNKMQTAEDKDDAAKEIAEDLTDRFDKWISEKENKKEESVKEEEQNEPLKIEEVD